MVKERNDLYLEKLDTLEIDVGEDYSNIRSKKIYQLNINANPKEVSNKGKRIVMECYIDDKEIYNDRQKKYYAYVDFYYKKYYNEVEKDKLSFGEIFLASLFSKNFLELYDILSNILLEDRLEQFMKDVIDMSSDGFILSEWQKDKFDEIIKNNYIESGVKEGIQSKEIEMIKNMLNKKIDYQTISEISSKSVEEIKEIEKNMKEEK